MTLDLKCVENSLDVIFENFLLG